MPRETIDAALACRLYDRLGNWRRVALAMPRQNGTCFDPCAIVAAVRRADRGVEPPILAYIADSIERDRGGQTQA